MKLVFLSHTAMGGPFVVGSHHLARALGGAGHEVSHVSAAISPAHAALALKDPFVRERWQRWLRGGRRFADVKDLVPFTLLPWPLARISPRLMSAYSRSMLVTPFQTVAAAGIYGADYLIVDDPRFVGVTQPPNSARVVYRATDLYAAMRNDPKILDAERSICARACLLVATSVRVAEHLQRLSGKKVHVVANGVDFEHFAQIGSTVGSERALPGRQQDRAIYVGAFDQRFGAEALRKAATQLPDKQFILIGPGANEFAAGLHAHNVIALGPVRYEVLPQILQRCSVGLLPMSSHASNDGRSPMKFYEYAAAGLCVAASTSHELRRRRQLPTLFLADSDDAFASTVMQAFDSSKSSERRAAASSIAKAESWQGKAEFLLELMRSEAEPAGTGAGSHERFAGQSAIVRSRVN
jgi:glycosyltransferase involved in cell wall biosynthesis